MPATSKPTAEGSGTSTRRAGPRRLLAWFGARPRALQWAVLTLTMLIPAGGAAAYILLHPRGAPVAVDREEARLWTFNDRLPVVLGSTSLLSFLDANPVERILVISRPLQWTVSERIILVETQGRLVAYYPGDMETTILTEKAVTAPWGVKLVFIPRSELRGGSLALVERLEQRFAGARPQSERFTWVPVASGVLSAALILGVLAFLALQMKGQFKPLMFLEPSDIPGSIGDLVGMDDIKAEVAQIKDQYQRRAAYAAYGVDKPFNVMFSGPAGTGKTRLAGFLAKDLGLPILFHSAANLETGLVAGGSTTLTRILAMAARRGPCIVFLDEAQDLFMKRGGRRKFDDDTSNTFLSVLDGVRSRKAAGILWIVASNFNSETMVMDEAMLRRFQMKVDFRMPNAEERLAIIRHYLGQRAAKVEPGLELRDLVAVTEGRSPADLETIVNQAGITAVQSGELIRADTLMQAAERVLVGNVNIHTTQERQRDRRIIATHEWGHFLVDLHQERQRTQDDWDQMLAEVKTLKISLKANPRTNALGFVFHKEGINLLKTRDDIEQEVRVLLGGMANEELFFGEEGTTNGAHNDITRVTRLLHHAVGEMGMYRQTRLNYGALVQDRSGPAPPLDEATQAVMEAQSERLYGETKAILGGLMPLTGHLVDKLLDAHEMTLAEALAEIRAFEERKGGAASGVA